MNPIQWVRWKRNRKRRDETFRSALEALPLHTFAVTWWWDKVNRLGVEAERTGITAPPAKGTREEWIYYLAQKRLMEWLLHGAPESGRPFFALPNAEHRPDDARGDRDR